MGRYQGDVLRPAKLVVLLLFCLLNPFAGWAYLATSRARWIRDAPPASDTVKRTRLAVVPLLGSVAAGSRVDAWLGAMLDGLGAYDALEIVSHGERPNLLETSRDSIASDTTLDADLVLEGSVSDVDDHLRLFARLSRVTDGSVLWSQAFDGTTEDFTSFCDEAVVGVLRALTTAPPQTR